MDLLTDDVYFQPEGVTTVGDAAVWGEMLMVCQINPKPSSFPDNAGI